VGWTHLDLDKVKGRCTGKILPEKYGQGGQPVPARDSAELLPRNFKQQNPN